MFFSVFKLIYEVYQKDIKVVPILCYIETVFFPVILKSIFRL